MSLRVRITLVATAVTAIALAAGAWGLVRSVERSQIARISARTEAAVDDVVAQLESGVDPAELQLPARPGFGVVQVIASGGDVLVGTPGDEVPAIVSDGGTASFETALTDRFVVATEMEGGGTIESGLPGSGASAIPLQVEYQRVDVPGGQSVIVAAASPLDEVGRSIDALRRSLATGLPLGTVLVAGVAWLVTGRALRPVESMRAEVEAITHSTLHRRVPEPATADEVGRLARTMNSMLDRLEASSERQRRFVADASHELRSPVAALRAELEVALASGETAALRSAVEGALAEERRLEVLLADLLALAAADDGAPPPPTPVDVGELAAVEAARPRRVPVDASGSGVVAGSAPQLRQVIANLVDNAARHATSEVQVHVDGGRIVVDDDGPGIAPTDRERVFERFTRLDEGRSRDDGGAGLGLAVVRAVVARHGGRVHVEAAPAGGARLVVDLPSGVA